MKTGIALSIVLTLTLSGFTLCNAGSITYGTSIDVSGNLKLIDFGTGFCFPDGTCMNSAINPDSVQWGDITGIIQNQTDLQAQMATKLDVSDRAATRTTVFNTIFFPETDNQWFQNTTWQVLSNQSFQYNLNLFEGGSLSLSYTDNVGIYADNVNGTFCTIGFFLNNSAIPLCSATFTGLYGYETYNQQTMNCDLQSIAAGQHKIEVKHISSNCKYGFSPVPAALSSRQLTIKFMRN